MHDESNLLQLGHDDLLSRLDGNILPYAFTGCAIAAIGAIVLSHFFRSGRTEHREPD